MVCEADGPIDQKRLAMSNKCLRVELSKPPPADRVTWGKNAPYPIPMVALASASVRSAAATSGRRSASCDGTPVGMGGGVYSIGLTGSEKSVAIFPTSIAIACSYCARERPTLMADDCADFSVAWASTTEI